MLLVYRGKTKQFSDFRITEIVNGGIYDITNIFTDVDHHVYGSIYGGSFSFDLGTPSEFKQNFEPYK